MTYVLNRIFHEKKLNDFFNLRFSIYYSQYELIFDRIYWYYIMLPFCFMFFMRDSGKGGRIYELHNPNECS